MLTVAVLGSGMAFLDGTVVNVALPDIGEDLGASTSDLQWILNGYLLTLASLILLGGSLGDRHGRRRIFVFGVGLFTAASLLCAIAPNAEMLIGARLIQGIGGALLTPGSLAMIEASFRPGDRARAIGAWSGLGGVAAALGPLLGGYLVEAVSWRAIFLINLPLGLFVMAMAPRHVPETRDPTATGRLDVAGATLVGLGLAGTTYALIEGPNGVGPAILVAGIGGVVALVAFLLVEHRSAEPDDAARHLQRRGSSAPPTWSRSWSMRRSEASSSCSSRSCRSRSATRPIEAGAASLPMTVLMLLFSARSGALAQRIGARIPLTVGPLVIAVGLLLMTRIDPGDSYVTSVLPALIVFGIGLTLVVSPVTATVLAAADARHSGIASGINNAVARVAGLLAVAVLPLIAGLTGDQFYDPAAMTDGFRMAMVVCAGLSAMGGILAWLTISSDVLEAEPEAPLEARRTDFSCGVAGTPLRPGRDGRGARAPAAGGAGR